MEHLSGQVFDLPTMPAHGRHGLRSPNRATATAIGYSRLMSGAAHHLVQEWSCWQAHKLETTRWSAQGQL